MQTVAIDARPRCGSRNVVRIVYGYPGEGLMEEAAAGRVALGGCVVYAGMPTRECKGYRHQWGRRRRKSMF